MSTAVHDELEAMARQIKREMGDEASAQYAFQEDGPWIETLRRLPFSCRLWQTFWAWDTAQRAQPAD